MTARVARWLLSAVFACALLACVPGLEGPSEVEGVETEELSPVTRLFLTARPSTETSVPGRHETTFQPEVGAATLRIHVDGDTFTRVAAWEFPRSFTPAAPTVQVRLSLVDSDGVALRWRLQRTDRCGHVRAESPTVTVDPADPDTGSVMFFTQWGVGDQALLVLDARRTRGDPTEPLQIGVGTGSSYIDVSLSEEKQAVDTGAPPRNPIRTALIETDASGLGAGDFRWNNQRVLWWNSHVRRWDAVLPTASPPADSSSNWWLWTDLVGEAEPALALTSRPSSPDVHWNDRTCALSVFFSRDASGTSRFHRYRYDPYADEYVVEVDSVAVPPDLRGSRRVTIIESPNGYLWAGVNHGGAVRVSRSTDGGSTWDEPAIIHRSVARGDNHWVVLSTGGSDRVGLAVTEDGGRVLFFHTDQDEVEWHRADRWTDESDSIPPPVGAERSDDELSAVSLGGEVFVVVETELGLVRRSEAIGLPQLLVYHRSSSGVWSSHSVNSYGADWENDLKRPTIAVNGAAGRLLVAASRSDRKASLVLSAALDDLDSWSQRVVFEVGDGADQAFYNMRVPRDPVDGFSGLPVLVVDQVSGHLWRTFLPSGLP